jgi:RNA polymerase sigma-70 factor, ECF subfamily
LSQIVPGRRLTSVNADTEPIAEPRSKSSVGLDFDAVFRAHYDRVSRAITAIVHDDARAEDLTVEVFWKLWLRPQANGPSVGGWLYRAAIRAGIDELRRQSRREQYERLVRIFRPIQRPDQIHETNELRMRVLTALASLKIRDSELLLLRNDGQTYEEIAEILGLNPASVGTLLSRAQEAFRKEYIKRYGNA